MDETKVIYHVNDEDTPYLVKLAIPPDRVTLADLKQLLQRPNCKYFFKSMDDDFGVVKEEIADDSVKLPCHNGRIVSWLVSTDCSTSDTRSQCAVSVADDQSKSLLRPSPSRSASSRTGSDAKTVETAKLQGHHSKSGHRHTDLPVRKIIGSEFSGRSSVLSSDIETTSFVDSDEDATSRVTGNTETTAASRFEHRLRLQRRRKHKTPAIARTSSFSSITDSTLSLNIMTVIINMDVVNFLGISIVGHSNNGGDGGIYVGSIMKGGAVALDGRIEPGDMLLEVNGISFENVSNDEAVLRLREAVHNRGSVKLVVAKCWTSPRQQHCFTEQLQHQLKNYGGSGWRSASPTVWITKAEAARHYTPTGGRWDGCYGRPFSDITSSSVTSSAASSLYHPHTASSPTAAGVTCASPAPVGGGEEETNGVGGAGELEDDQRLLSTECSMIDIVRAAARPDSGLDIRDRMWLKITIPRAFIGSELVDWLQTHVRGLHGIDRREARRYATSLLRSGFIRHTVNKTTFSEQCYYVFSAEALTATPPLQTWQHSIVYQQQKQVQLPQCAGVIGEMEWAKGMDSGEMWETAMKNLSSLTLDDIDSVSEVGKYRHYAPRLISSSSSNPQSLVPHPTLTTHPFHQSSTAGSPCWVSNAFNAVPVNHHAHHALATPTIPQYAGPPPSYSHVIGRVSGGGHNDGSGNNKTSSCSSITPRSLAKSKSLSGSSASGSSGKSNKKIVSSGSRSTLPYLAPPYTQHSDTIIQSQPSFHLDQSGANTGHQWRDDALRTLQHMTPLQENPYSGESVEHMGDV